MWGDGKNTKVNVLVWMWYPVCSKVIYVVDCLVIQPISLGISCAQYYLPRFCVFDHMLVCDYGRNTSLPFTQKAVKEPRSCTDIPCRKCSFYSQGTIGKLFRDRYLSGGLWRRGRYRNILVDTSLIIRSLFFIRFVVRQHSWHWS